MPDTAAAAGRFFFAAGKAIDPSASSASGIRTHLCRAVGMDGGGGGSGETVRPQRDTDERFAAAGGAMGVGNGQLNV